MKTLADFLASHRIAVSRSIAVLFFVVLMSADGALSGTFFSALLFFVGLVLVGLATVGRMWCALYISGYKNRELVTAGPYSLTRNPLYFFSSLGFVGIGFATGMVSLGVVTAVVFALVYPVIIRREEGYLQTKFGQTFTDYCRSTPRFFPALRSPDEPRVYVVEPKFFRRALGDVLWFVLLLGVIALVRALHELHIIVPLLRLP